MRKAVALLEVVGVLVAGWAGSGWLLSTLEGNSLGPDLQKAIHSDHPDFLTLSLDWTKQMVVQYACLLLPAFVIGWWRRRLGRRYYGIATAGQPVRVLAFSGLVAFALVAMPIKLLWVAKRFVPLGSGPAFWALLDKSWTPAFWLFLAVSSFALVPVLEEVLFRGYMQTRLEEDFGGVGAIVIVTLVMTFGHNQYFHLSLLSLGTMISLIPLCLGMGYVYWRSRSLIPGIVIHAAVNLPTKGIGDFLLPAAMMVALVLFRRHWAGMTQDFIRQATGKELDRSVVAGAAAGVILVFGYETCPRWFVPVALFGLSVALVIDSRERREQGD